MSRIQWKPETRKLVDLTEYEGNPRLITEAGLDQIEESYDEIGMAVPINISTKNVILSGHARARQLIREGQEEVQVQVPDRELTPSQEEAVVLRLNKTQAGSWDYEKLSKNFKLERLLKLNFDRKDLTIKKASITPDNFETGMNEINKQSFIAQIRLELSRIIKVGIEEDGENIDELDIALLVETHIVQQIKEITWSDIEKDITD